eukprot:6569808-Pyramimonas_sp.AAC.1
MILPEQSTMDSQLILIILLLLPGRTPRWAASLDGVGRQLGLYLLTRFPAMNAPIRFELLRRKCELIS